MTRSQTCVCSTRTSKYLEKRGQVRSDFDTRARKLLHSLEFTHLSAQCCPANHTGRTHCHVLPKSGDATSLPVDSPPWGSALKDSIQRNWNFRLVQPTTHTRFIPPPRELESPLHERPRKRWRGKVPSDTAYRGAS